MKIPDMPRYGDLLSIYNGERWINSNNESENYWISKLKKCSAIQMYFHRHVRDITQPRNDEKTRHFRWTEVRRET